MTTQAPPRPKPPVRRPIPNYGAMSQSVVDALGIGRCCGCLTYVPVSELERVPSLDGHGNRYCVDRSACHARRAVSA